MKKCRIALSKIGQQGFTLIELMVVVAIIGILSAVAVPNFKKYQAKSRTSEAKLQLAALFSAEASFYTDVDRYATCLADMAYDPRNEKDSRYYMVGFAKASGLDGKTINIVCDGQTTDDGQMFFAAGKALPGSAAASSSADLNGTDSKNAAEVKNNEQEYVAGAYGFISTDLVTSGKGDRWLIDENKVISHDRKGY